MWRLLCLYGKVLLVGVEVKRVGAIGVCCEQLSRVYDWFWFGCPGLDKRQVSVLALVSSSFRVAEGRRPEYC